MPVRPASRHRAVRQRKDSFFHGKPNTYRHRQTLRTRIEQGLARKGINCRQTDGTVKQKCKVQLHAPNFRKFTQTGILYHLSAVFGDNEGRDRTLRVEFAGFYQDCIIMFGVGVIMDVGKSQK